MAAASRRVRAVCYARATPLKAILALALAFFASPALAQQPSCTPPLAPMLRVEFYFGLAIKGRAPVTRAEWEGFVGRELTPRFPGLTVLDAHGAWRDGKREVREASKLVVVVTADGPAIRSAIAEASEAYKARFHQSSVGIVTQPVCAAF
ncbi:MAG TPA: DUF3574 domain-containing protein [Pseudolabrys sp.]